MTSKTITITRASGDFQTIATVYFQNREDVMRFLFRNFPHCLIKVAKIRRRKPVSDILVLN